MKVALAEERKVRPKRYKELCDKIRDFIRSTSNNADHYDKKYMKIKLNSDHNSPLRKH